VSDNTGTLLGGGILNVGPLAIDSSTVSGNFSVGHGGGLFDLGLAGEEPTLGRTAAGALQGAGDSWIVNSTFSDNAVRFGQGGGIFHASLGGEGECEGTYGVPTGGTSTDPCEEPVFGSTLSIDSSTLADNSTVNADNVYVPIGESYGRGASVFAYGPVELSRSIIANGTDRGRADDCATAGGQGFIESLGGNVSTGDTCQLDSEIDKPGTDPLLGELRDNGGPTETRALRPGSPAIDATDAGECPDTDQRGGARPPEDGSAGARCDAGAYEAGSLADLSVETLAAAPDPATAGSPLTYTTTVRNDGPDAAKGVKLTLPVPAELVSAAPSKGTCTNAVECDLGTLADGESVHVRVVVKPAAAGTLTARASVRAPGLTDGDGSNDSEEVATPVDPAPVQQQQGQQQPPDRLPDTQGPQGQDNQAKVKLTVPKSVTLKQFLSGITVSADCGEDCLRRFREHVGINTGGTRIAGYNLTVSRGSLGYSARTNKVKLRPCTEAGRKKKQCLRNLTKAAKKAAPFKVKVVVTAIDRAGNRTAAKAFVTVKSK
jgi:uncharacterized repeat protein (TIGR01451 family)